MTLSLEAAKFQAMAFSYNSFWRKEIFYTVIERLAGFKPMTLFSLFHLLLYFIEAQYIFPAATYSPPLPHHHHHFMWPRKRNFLNPKAATSGVGDGLCRVCVGEGGRRGRKTINGKPLRGRGPDTAPIVDKIIKSGFPPIFKWSFFFLV